MTDLWPWPGDTPTERARAVANSLLALLPAGDRDHAIRQARAVGETWLGANLLRWDKTDVVTTAEAAELAHVGASTIRKWHSDGHLPNQGRGRYVVAHVLDCAAARRRERAERCATYGCTRPAIRLDFCCVPCATGKVVVRGEASHDEACDAELAYAISM